MKRSSSTTDDINREILKVLQKDTDTTAPSNDEDELFGQSIGESLKKMSDGRY